MRHLIWILSITISLFPILEIGNFSTNSPLLADGESSTENKKVEDNLKKEPSSIEKPYKSEYFPDKKEESKNITDSSSPEKSKPEEKENTNVVSENEESNSKNESEEDENISEDDQGDESENKEISESSDNDSEDRDSDTENNSKTSDNEKEDESSNSIKPEEEVNEKVEKISDKENEKDSNSDKKKNNSEISGNERNIQISKKEFITLLKLYPRAILKNTKFLKTKTEKINGYRLSFVGDYSIANGLGIKTDDILIKLNSVDVTDEDSLIKEFYNLSEKEEFTLDLISGKENIKYNIKVVSEEEGKNLVSIDKFLRYYLTFEPDDDLLPLKNENPEETFDNLETKNFFLFWKLLKDSYFELENLFQERKVLFGPDPDGNDGIKFFKVTKESFFGKLGVKQGDKIIQINGHSLRTENDPKKLVKLITQIKFYNTAIVDLERDGKIYRHNYIFKDKYYSSIGVDYLSSKESSSPEFLPKKGEDIEEKKEEKSHFYDESSDTYIPIDPSSGIIYDDTSLKQFNELKKSLPDNMLIPQVLTKKEYNEFVEKQKRFREIDSKLDSEKLPKEDVNFYFTTLEKVFTDRLDILEHLNKITGDFPEETMEKAREKTKKEIIELKKRWEKYK